MKKGIFVLVLTGAAILLAACGTLGSSGGQVQEQGVPVSFFSVDLANLPSARTTITHTETSSFTDELQWLAVQTACIGIYNMEQTGNYTLSDPHDYYQPNHIRSYLTALSGDETKNTMFYGICFNYAQAAYEDILQYQSHYENLGMRQSGWYIAAAFDNSGEIILFDPVSRENASMIANGVSVKENSRHKVRTHGSATKHAWLWVYGADGTIYWIDPTWTDNAGYVVWGIVQNGAEVDMAPAASLSVVNINPADTGFEDFGRGNSAKSRGDYDLAIAEYSEAIRRNPNNPIAYYNRGLAYYQKRKNAKGDYDNGDYDRALADYTQALRLDPNFAVAYNARALVYYQGFHAKEGGHARGIADTTQAIRLDPNYAEAYNTRGDLYQQKKDYDAAIAEYSKAIRFNPNYAEAYANRAIAYYRKLDYDRAIADGTQAIRLDPNYVWAYNARALAYYKKGNRRQARADLTRALQIDPTNSIIRSNLK
jgi:tetratricopeptide (TPR) repeat protein